MFSKSLSVFITIAVCLGTFSGSAGAQTSTVLKGNVREEGRLQSQGGAPSLSRKDLEEIGDPFGSRGQVNASPEDTQALDVPAQAFQAVALPPRNDGGQRNFGLGADLDEFGGTALPATSDTVPQAPSAGKPAMSGGPPANPAAQTADPDSWLQLEWEAWHRRVAESIYQRWIVFANTAFKYDRTPKLARIDYVVTRDGQIQDVKFLRRSNNPMFDALIMQVVKSFNGERQILQFPEGSRRASIEKFGDFSQNQHVGAGYRYTTGDKESIRRR